MQMTSRLYQGLTALLLLGSGLLLAAAPATAAGPKNGEEWELKTTMEMPGLPFAIPPTVVRQCIEDKAVPYQQQEGEKCETVYKNFSGNTLKWRMVCTGKDGKMEMTGESTYSGNTMDSRIKMKSSQGDMAMHMTGKKLGPCK
ncbi:MAG: DUF3617 family protein [Desulfobulbaceae bacterium]|nr:DUF3617 family protein [Desulfobulbaceae bacterium]